MLAQQEAETIVVVVDANGAYNLMAKAEKRKQEDSHSLEEEGHILQLMKRADNAMDENEMNWKSVHCEVKEHGPFVVVAAAGHKLHLKRTIKVHGDD